MLDFTTLRTLGAVAAAATLIAAPSGAETLRLAHWVPPAHTLTASTIVPLQEAVAAAGLEIQVYPGGELGAGPLEQYIRAVTGVADITWGLQGYTSSQFPRTMIAELPGALPEGMTGYDMLWNAY
ncbi:MAG: C4-dicarboxylate ABC transporter substrate-binding protein, partial [Pararhodobacter sp.]|nr:C4-dicarboxylate ABC transporter substrate-binding protein [Pararhodobacter sp.]